MIELLILHELNNSVLTMYGISKAINRAFSVLTIPSFGTIKPALTRLEKKGCLKTRKSMSEGGRPSVYYSITSEGKLYLKQLILETPQENPVQFLTSARLKLSCAEVLNESEQAELYNILRHKAEAIVLDTKNIIENEVLKFHTKMVFDNLMCEYKNFISLTEGFSRACKN